MNLSNTLLKLNSLLKLPQKHLAVKLFLMTLLLMMVISSTASLIVFSLGYRTLKKEIRSKLIMAASSIASLIDAEKIKQIKDVYDEKKPVYQEIQKLLQNIQKTNYQKIKYIYVISHQNGRYTYILDAIPSNLSDHSSIGTIFPVEKYPQAVKGFISPTADLNPISDAELPGILSQSAYAPIRDKQGKVVGMLGIDIDVSVLNREKNDMIRVVIAGNLIAFILTMVLAFWFSIQFTKPILKLSGDAQSVINGNLEVKFDLNRPDELGHLSHSLSEMLNDIKQSQNELRDANEELEAKVRIRTEELQAINGEYRDILDTINEALLTINCDLTINPHFSRFTTELFDRDDFSGLKLPVLLFPNESQLEERQLLESWLKLTFENNCIGWDDLKLLQPLEELEIEVGNPPANKCLRIGFRPVCSIDAKENPTKIMVTIEDITGARKLEETILKKEQEYQENINQIIEIIKIDQELFKEFINDCQENLHHFESKLIFFQKEPGNLEIFNELLRIMHTLKGTSKIFKLERLADKAHTIESILFTLEKNGMVVTDNILNHILSEIDHFYRLLNETSSLYERIIQSIHADSGRTRNQARLKQDSQLFKIRTTEFFQLQSLINQATSMVNMPIKENSQENLKEVLIQSKALLDQMRKIPIDQLFTRFQRMVRDISQELNKKAKLTIEGEQVLIDKIIFDKLGDPLIHLLRNSLDHGIEKPSERIQLHKSEEGQISLKVELFDSDSRLLITLKDDGRGIDTQKVVKKALAQGLIQPPDLPFLSEADILNLVFTPGFSTNDWVTNISGRGIGLDVVKNNIEKELQGVVKLNNQPLKGLQVDIIIPLLTQDDN